MKRACIALSLMCVLICFASMSLVSCTGNREVTAVIYDNIKALNNEDLEASMATIHEESPIYAATRQVTKELFLIYDLKYKLKQVKVVEKSDQEIKVEYVQTTERIDGPEFKDNKIKAVSVLKKSKGKWKIFSTIIKGIEYLDE